MTTDTTIHLCIQKKCAASVIKDLQKLDAVEVIEIPEIPEWQQKEVRKRLKNMQKKSGEGIERATAINKIKSYTK